MTDSRELQYADDNALVAHKEKERQTAMDTFSHAYSALGLIPIARKTQVTEIGLI